MASGWVIAILVSGIIVVSLISYWLHEVLVHMVEKRVDRPRPRSKKSTRDR
jgi:hypothetical protein